MKKYGKYYFYRMGQRDKSLWLENPSYFPTLWAKDAYRAGYFGRDPKTRYMHEEDFRRRNNDFINRWHIKSLTNEY